MMGGKLFCWKKQTNSLQNCIMNRGYKLDYKTLRKNYRLYIRSAGLLAMLLIVCIGLLVRDTLLQTGGLLLVLAGLLFIHPMDQEELH